MKVVKILGGLGNQMFQYAFYLSCKQRFNDVSADITEFKNYPLHNGYELECVFGIKVKHSNLFHNISLGGRNTDLLSKISRKLVPLPKTYYEQVHATHFDENIFKDSSSGYYEGYWQNERYFEGVEPLLKHDFQFKNKLNHQNSEIDKDIVNSPSVGIHIRRGDYVNHELLGGICDLNYYKLCIEVVQKRVENPRFFIFSNDPSWCKQYLDLKGAVYINWNVGPDSYIDMQLMSRCQTLIIANSSFSWWSAWLNEHPEKLVLAPSKWFNYGHDINEIVPTTWVKI